MVSGKLVTLQRHILEEQGRHPEATGDFTRMLWDLTLALKIISREVNKAGLIEILGATDNQNVHGERVMKLDAYAQDRIYKAMDHGGHLCVMASEECEEIIPIPPHFQKGRYVLIFDPLDGSSNIDCNVSIGTIFSILRRRTPGGDGTLEDVLQKGTEQVAAGYVIYGSSTMLVYTTGAGVHGFTLDPSVGEFLLSHPNIRVPNKGKTYSINEGNSKFWDRGTKKFVDWLKDLDQPTNRPYSLRYVGSLVADMHRTLLQGGIFMYPVDQRDPNKPPKPKLRLMYEANPMAFIMEHAGGMATTGEQRILDITPTALHQKVPLIIGSPWEVQKYLEIYRQEMAPEKAQPLPA
ncbi:MAG TPA: class 1 fructose-bisphosphatase [Candidatus Nitrosotenuis sp.]|jgi:fructose-1,6-bisphosphatase I|nr:class 1 fructose-bisphosphatase [Candidatus Nitrosotenuis sp.]